MNRFHYESLDKYQVFTIIIINTIKTQLKYITEWPKLHESVYNSED